MSDTAASLPERLRLPPRRSRPRRGAAQGRFAPLRAELLAIASRHPPDTSTSHTGFRCIIREQRRLQRKDEKRRSWRSILLARNTLAAAAAAAGPYCTKRPPAIRRWSQDGPRMGKAHELVFHPICSPSLTTEP
jgi:hypothetical protein